MLLSALTSALPELALTLTLQGNTFPLLTGEPSFLPRDQLDPFVTLILCLTS